MIRLLRLEPCSENKVTLHSNHTVLTSVPTPSHLGTFIKSWLEQSKVKYILETSRSYVLIDDDVDPVAISAENKAINSDFLIAL